MSRQLSGSRGHRLVDRQRLVELRERLVELARLHLLHRRLASARAQAVDAGAAGQLGEPRAEGLVVPQPVEMGVDAREDVLEDVLRVVLGEAEALRADRVDVAREALDELVPGRRSPRRQRPTSSASEPVRAATRPSIRRDGEGLCPPSFGSFRGSGVPDYADLTSEFGGTMTLRVVDLPPFTL